MIPMTDTEKDEKEKAEKAKSWADARIKTQIQYFSELRSEPDHGIRKLREKIWTYQADPTDDPDLPKIMLKAMIKSNNLRGLDLLIEKDMISKEMKEEVEPVIDAIGYTQNAMLRSLINYGFDIHGQYEGPTWQKGLRPVEIGARYGAAATLRTLFIAGAKPNTECFTDICEAAYFERKQSVAVILNQYDLKLLREIAKSEVDPFAILIKDSPETIKKWKRMDLSRTHQRSSALIKFIATKLLKEKELSCQMTKIKKSEEEISI